MRFAIGHVATGLILVAATAGCSRDAAAPSSVVEVGNRAQTVARGFAMALAHETIRRDLRDVLRASPLVEHKVPLRQFVHQPAGRRFIDVAAKAMDMSSAEFQAAIASLPPMHMYMPRRVDRRGWRATANIVVAAVLDNDDAPVTVWSKRGLRQIADIRGSDAVLLLEPAEPASLRHKPQMREIGSVIQDEDDGEFGGVFHFFDARGTLVKEVQLAHMLQEAENACYGLGGDGSGMIRGDMIAHTCGGGGGGGGGGPASDTTFLQKYFVDQYISDGIGQTEVEFRARMFNSDGSPVGSNTIRIDGCYWQPTAACSTPNIPLMFLRIRENTAQMINVEVVELDQFSNDNYGNRYFLWSDNGVSRPFSGGGQNSHMTLRWTPIQ